MRLPPILIAIALVPGVAAAQDDADSDAIHAVTVIHEDGTKTSTITDPEKHSAEATTYDARDKVLEKIVYALDDTNQIASGIVYNANNRAVFKAAYKRDDMNRMAEEDDYTMNDQLLRRFVYEYGPTGRLVRIRAYDSQGNEMQESNAHKDQRQSLPRIH